MNNSQLFLLYICLLFRHMNGMETVENEFSHIPDKEQCNQVDKIYYVRSDIFYDEKNPFYAANMLFDRSDYDGAILLYKELVNSPNIDATQEQKLLAYNALGQAYRAKGNLKKGYKYIAAAMNNSLARPLTKKIFHDESYASKTLLVRCTDDTRRFGIGDMLSDAAYLKELTKQRCFRTVALVSSWVQALYQNAHCADMVITPEDAVMDYDYETTLFALPYFLAITTVHDIPQERTFDVSFDRYHYWKEWVANNCSAQSPSLIWHVTSDFPVPEGRQLRSRKVPLKEFIPLASGPASLICISLDHAPISRQQWKHLPEEQQHACLLDVIDEGHKKLFVYAEAYTLEDIFALAQVIVDSGGYCCGPDTAISNGLAYSLQSNRRLCVLMPYHGDARWGEHPGASLSKKGRLPNYLEFWQQREGSWSEAMQAAKEYIAKK